MDAKEYNEKIAAALSFALKLTPTAHQINVFIVGLLNSDLAIVEKKR